MPTRSAGSLAGVLLASLNPAAVADGADIGDAVRIDGAVLSRSDLVGAATSVAERVGGAQRVAVLATPTATTVLAVTGCLIAGVPVVPVPADVGAAERRHILTDSGAQAWLGERPDDAEGLPHIPVRLHARSWHRYRRTAAGCHRADHVHLRNHGTAEGRRAEPARHRRRHRRAGRGLAVDARRHPGARASAVPRPRPRARGCSARCGSETASCTPENPRRPPTPRPRVRCTSGCRRCGRGWSTIPTRRWRCRRPGCWCRAARRCRCRCSTSWPSSPATRRWSGTAAPNRLITLSTLADGERRPGWVGLPLSGVQTRLVDDDGRPVAA